MSKRRVQPYIQREKGEKWSPQRAWPKQETFWVVNLNFNEIRDKCNQCFTQISSLQKHARVHDKMKPYQWSFEKWGMAFTQVYTIKDLIKDS